MLQNGLLHSSIQKYDLSLKKGLSHISEKNVIQRKSLLEYFINTIMKCA